MAFGISKVLTKKNNYFQLRNKFCSLFKRMFENVFTNVVQTCFKNFVDLTWFVKSLFFENVFLQMKIFDNCLMMCV